MLQQQHPGSVKYATLFLGALMIVCFFMQKLVVAGDALDVKRDSDRTVYMIGATDEKNNALDGKRDKEKNVYSIGSSKEKRNQEAWKEERSWDMLMNMGIWQGNPDYRDPSEKPPAPGQHPKDKSPQKNHPKE